VRASKAQNILELGTFTGYATICLAEGLGAQTGERRGKIVTCELDRKTAGIAKKNFEATAYSPLVGIILL
jgi:caffeoyl-CoA O-methyltransferase